LVKHSVAALIAAGIALAGCAPPPPYPYEAANQRPVPLDPAHLRECAMLRDQIARQQYIAETSGINANAIVEASVRLNTWNVINGLQERAAVEGCS
jgi:hypothetical protein